MKTKFFYGMAVMTALGLASCSSDNLVNDEPKVVDKDTQLFIKVSIADPGESSTRAGNEDNTDKDNYIDGSPEEMKINKVLFVFYDGLGNYINSQTLTNFEGTPGNGSGSIETTLQIIVPVELKEGQGMPEYVMAYVNPTEKASSDVNQALNRVLCLTRTHDQIISTDDHAGYTMSNSVYYEGKDQDLPVIATKLPEGALFESEEAAKNNEDTDKETLIYVERVVAKVVVTNEEGAFDPSPSNNQETVGDYTLSFQPLSWGVNNVERNTFLIKNFRSQETNGSAVTEITNLTYGTANNDAHMGNLTKPSWNYTEGHRTFWAYSPTYFNGGKYPETADIYGNGDGFSLDYRSYNDIYDSDDKQTGKWGSELGEDNCLYTLENTMRPSVIADEMGRAVTSVTIVGKYNLKKGTDLIEDGTSFYISRGTGDISQYRIWVGNDMKKEFMEKNSVVYIKVVTKSEGESDKVEYVPVPYADQINGEDNPYLAAFEVTHPEQEIYGKVPLASRHVTLQMTGKDLNEENGDPIYYYRNANGIMVPVNDNDITTVNIALYSSFSPEFGAIESFKSGMAYFNVPIKHLWASATSGIGDKDYNPLLGHYGVVRNHIYNINIQGISGIGTGINDPNDPIIPNVTEMQYYVKTKLLVQRWRLVPKQNVILKP
ncbi:MAG: Mfa1 family fimbria major subunit [Muribaculaceae bacterium]|nr:Mfa1 family fimbria major subunit [Muribaculaceae bacterium]